MQDIYHTELTVDVGLSEAERERWNQCVTGSLAEINRLNTVEMVSFVTGLSCLSELILLRDK